MIVAEKFQTYDNGYFDNYKKYGQMMPIMYDLKKVTAPLALYYSVNDVLAQKSVKTLLLFLCKIYFYGRNQGKQFFIKNYTF